MALLRYRRFLGDNGHASLGLLSSISLRFYGFQIRSEPSVFRSDQIRTLAAKRASVVRAQDLDVPFLYYRSVAIRESRGRRDAVRLVEASFTAKKK